MSDERVPCPSSACRDGLYKTTDLEGRSMWDVCPTCLGCRTVPVRNTNTQTERKAA